MASYEEAGAVAITEITGELGGVSEDVTAAINDILGEGAKDAIVMEVGGTVPAGTPAPQILAYSDTATPLTNAAALTAPVLIMQEGTSIRVDLGANSPVQAMVIGNGGKSSITSTADKGDLSIALTGGEGDQVSLAGTNDNVTFNGGSATINAGTGSDVVTVKGLEGTNSTVNISQGEGDLTVFWQAAVDTAATIDAGAGFDKLMINTAEGRGDHYFTIENGKAVMHSETTPVTMDNMEVVIFDTTPNNPILTRDDQMTIISQNEGDTLVGRLYQIAYGRQPFDNPVAGQELAGIKWWMDKADTVDFKDPEALQHFVYSFLNTDEFHLGELNNPKNGMGYDNVDDDIYVKALFDNLNLVNDGKDVTEIHGRTAEEYAQLLKDGVMNRYDVAWQIAASTEADDILGIDGTGYVIEPWADNDQA